MTHCSCLASTVLWGLLLTSALVSAVPSGTQLVLTDPVPDLSSPNGTIKWWRCPDAEEFQCAYFDVPLDHNNPIPDENVSIFLRKLPATVPTDQRLGSLFTNPGGPGVSGSQFLVLDGHSISTVVEGRYDIISFDPRGVNMTLPPIDCYSSDHFSKLFELEMLRAGTPTMSARGLEPAFKNVTEFAAAKRLLSYLEVPNLACQSRGNERMLKALTTIYVARDIVSILKALGEYERGLYYWGFSYGTILGTTFAANFPDLATRMVLDGVADSISYSQNLWDWGRGMIVDSGAVLKGFFKECTLAGYPACQFADPGITKDRAANLTPQELEKHISSLQTRLDSVYDTLASNPLPSWTTGTGFGVLHASDIQEQIFLSLYLPQSWPKLAASLAAIEQGNATEAYGQVYARFTDFHAAKNGSISNVFGKHLERDGSFIWATAIRCSDSGEMLSKPGDEGVEEFVDYIHELLRIGPTGETRALKVGLCRAWKYRPLARFTGPWTEEGLKKTRYPILFVGNTADPVTPLRSARRMAEAFGRGSASLLIQDGYGHCSTAEPSLCTAKKIRDYLLLGTIPEYGTICSVEKYDIFRDNAARFTSMSIEDQNLLEAMKQIGHRIAGRG